MNTRIEQNEQEMIITLKMKKKIQSKIGRVINSPRTILEILHNTNDLCALT